jgi:pimeloyl-ACP methyl ester carboxylesterase
VLEAEKIVGPVVVVGHSLGGLIAATFAHQYPTQVAGVVLLDATAPSVSTAIAKLIPATATGAPAAVREEVGAFSSAATNPEKLVSDGSPVGSLGAVPLTVVQHGKPIYAPVPTYGTRLQTIWATGQHQLAALSSTSKSVTARRSGHYIYLDQPALATKLIENATAVQPSK